VNQRLASAIVACLRLSGPPGDPRQLTGYSRRDWQQALQWLDWSGLALPFWSRLEELQGRNCIPEELGTQLARSLADHRHRIAEMVAEFDQINRVFEGAGIRYAALKGFALIPDYCPDAALRTTYDYDYLIAPEHLAVAREVLASAGFARKDDPAPHSAVYVRAAAPPLIPSTRDQYYSAGLAREVELHWALWEPESVGIPLALPTDVMDRLRQHTGLGISFPALAEEDELLFQVLHTLRHILRYWCRLGSFLDLAYFINRRARDQAFWRAFADRVRHSRLLQEIAGVVFWLACDLFGVPIPSPVAAISTQTMRPSLLAWVRYYGRASAIDNFAANKFSLFLHRELVPDEAAWQAVRRNSLLPWYRPYKAAAAASPAWRVRMRALWWRGLYTARRLVYHAKSAAQYAWESGRWRRLRASAGG
jgi:hypothetical protein